jgi:uncharacterized protein DUF6412
MSLIAFFAFNPSDVLVLAAVVLVAMAIMFAARAVGILPPAPARPALVPVRSRPVAVVRQIDPDAAGRPRPRAPGF